MQLKKFLSHTSVENLSFEELVVFFSLSKDFSQKKYFPGNLV
jgi:hypothetical protein